MIETWLAIAMAAAGPQAATSEARGTPPHPVGEVGQWFGPAAYPPAAMRAGEQGRVLARIDVDARGLVTDCVIATSSGSAALDQETCRIAKSRIGFVPARDDKGTAVAGSYRLPVRWVLPGNGAPPNFSVVTTVAIGLDGAVETCETAPAFHGTGPGPCGNYPVGRKVMAPQMRDGRPVKAHVVVSMDVATTLDP